MAHLDREWSQLLVNAFHPKVEIARDSLRLLSDYATNQDSGEFYEKGRFIVGSLMSEHHWKED